MHYFQAEQEGEKDGLRGRAAECRQEYEAEIAEFSPGEMLGKHNTHEPIFNINS